MTGLTRSVFCGFSSRTPPAVPPPADTADISWIFIRGTARRLRTDWWSASAAVWRDPTMTNEAIDEKAVFNMARGIAAPEERAAYLQQACGHYPDALRRILDLL